MRRVWAAKQHRSTTQSCKWDNGKVVGGGAAMMWPAEVKLGIHNEYEAIISYMNIADYSFIFSNRLRLLELTKLFDYMQKYTPWHLKIIHFSPILYSLACVSRSERPHFTYVLGSHSLTSQHLQEWRWLRDWAHRGSRQTRGPAGGGADNPWWWPGGIRYPNSLEHRWVICW